jgi:purine-nucleoside phosphorylase
MSKLIDALEANSLPNNMLLDIYGVPDNEHFDCVFVAPSWTVEKVFDTTNIDIEQIFYSRDAKTYRIRHNGKNYLFITLYIGAPVIVDFCLLCYKAKCDNFVFIGSTGALVPEINVGDIIVPDYAISGNGVTVYLHDKLDANNMFEHISADVEQNEYIRKIGRANGINMLNVPIISMDSIMAEYLHLEEFRQMGAHALEMEAATFFASMNHINKKASAILVVSDNSANGDHLVGRDDAEKADYHSARRQVSEILLHI